MTVAAVNPFERGPSRPANDAPLECVDLACERDVLGAGLLEQGFIDRSEVVPGDYHSLANAAVWSALLQLRALGRPLSPTELRARLTETGEIRRVESDFLLDLENVLPPAANPKRLRELARKREIIAATRRLQRALASGEDVEQAFQRLDEARVALAEVETGSAPRLLDDLWKTVGERQWLDHQPPPQRWLLRRDDPETNGATQVGVLPQGEVGFFIAHGGVGKTYAMIQLAIAVATGRKWLDHFLVGDPGRVMLALGEDTALQAHRRLWAAADAMRLTDAQRDLVRDRVVVLPLSGKPTALVAGMGDHAGETALYQEFRERLSEHEWKLIVIDPLARFAGPETEKDNVAATRFVQMIEALTHAAHGCNAIIVHHKNKLSRTPGADSGGGRGVTGLESAGRWSAELTSLSDDRVKLAVTKHNNAPPCPVVHLRRDIRNAGCLRAETSEETKDQAASSAEARLASKSTEVDDDARALSRALAGKPAMGARRLRELAKLDLSWGVTRLDLARARLERGIEGVRLADESHSPATNHSYRVVPMEEVT